MKHILLLFFVFVYFLSSAQNYWYKEIETNYYQKPIGDIVIQDDYYYFSSLEEYSHQPPYQEYYSILNKVSETGNILSSDILREDLLNMLGTIVTLENGNLLSIGHICLSIENAEFALWKVEFDSSMSIISQEIDTTDINFGYIMNSFRSTDGDIYFQMATSDVPFSGLPQGAYIAKLASDYQLVRDTLFEQTIYDIAVNISNSEELIMYSRNLDQNPEINLYQLNRFDTNFHLINTPISFTPENMSYFSSIHVSTDSNYYLSSMCKRGDGVWVNSYANMKVNMDFDSVSYIAHDTLPYWHFTPNHNGIDSYENKIYSGGNFEYRGMSQTYPNYFTLTRMDASLNMVNQRFYGGDKNYLLNSIKTTPEGDVLLLGHCSDLDSDKWNVFIMKVNPEGLITSTNNYAEIPIKIAIVLPNPGREYMELHTGACPATLQLHNLNGSLVLEEAIYSDISRINTLELSSGTYIWSLVKEGKVVETGKWVRE